MLLGSLRSSLPKDITSQSSTSPVLIFNYLKFTIARLKRPSVSLSTSINPSMKCPEMISLKIKFLSVISVLSLDLFNSVEKFVTSAFFFFLLLTLLTLIVPLLMHLRYVLVIICVFIFLLNIPPQVFIRCLNL